MKQIIITTTLFIGLTAQAFAQQPLRPRIAPDKPVRRTAPQGLTIEQRAQNQTDRLSERLSLTNDQKAKVYNLNLEKLKKERDTRQARIKQMQEQRKQDVTFAKNQDDQLGKILNNDQRKAYQQMKDQRKRLMQRYAWNNRIHRGYQNRPYKDFRRAQQYRMWQFERRNDRFRPGRLPGDDRYRGQVDPREYNRIENRRNNDQHNSPRPERYNSPKRSEDLKNSDTAPKIENIKPDQEIQKSDNNIPRTNTEESLTNTL